MITRKELNKLMFAVYIMIYLIKFRDAIINKLMSSLAEFELRNISSKI